MESYRETRLHMIVFLIGIFFTRACVSEITFPKAQNVAWSSINFKTLLTWSPKPTNYSYTVEFYQIGQNRERTPNCIRSVENECDLTSELKDLKATYSADILSEPPRGVNSDLIEAPHTTSDRFSPYNDTVIGRPEFEIEVSSDKRKTTLLVKDVPTALFNERNERLTIRDVFMDDLQYKVIYRKAKSTGKKEKISKSSTIDLTDLDRGVSYCFNVQAYLAHRKVDKQLGELSQTKCSPEEDSSIFEQYGVGVIAIAILIIILAVSAIIIIIVLCYKRRNNAKNTEKEGQPLNDV
ncbi:coagulation factor III, tissue factor a [Paramisgurnus dabryanus]|uniref:coagulation factor III, tissue factor a n=1 Tax=Paramisgurnus dabryanus TaxID=90735 RepID=UPI0031F38987